MNIIYLSAIYGVIRSIHTHVFSLTNRDLFKDIDAINVDYFNLKVSGLDTLLVTHAGINGLNFFH